MWWLTRRALIAGVNGMTARLRHHLAGVGCSSPTTGHQPRRALRATLAMHQDLEQLVIGPDNQSMRLAAAGGTPRCEARSDFSSVFVDTFQSLTRGN